MQPLSSNLYGGQQIRALNGENLNRAILMLLKSFFGLFLLVCVPYKIQGAPMDTIEPSLGKDHRLWESPYRHPPELDEQELLPLPPDLNFDLSDDDSFEEDQRTRLASVKYVVDHRYHRHVYNPTTHPRQILGTQAS